jgi:hypothetical protein
MGLGILKIKSTNSGLTLDLPLIAIARRKDQAPPSLQLVDLIGASNCAH